MSFNRVLAVSGTLALLFAAGCAPVRQIVRQPGEAPSSATPTPVPSPAGPVTIAFTGDIMMGDSAAYQLKTKGPDSFFVHTAPYLKQADLAMGNLEGPLGRNGEKFPHKKYNFLVDPTCATGLAHAGFKLLTMANNHTMDFGVEALKSTIQALDSQGLKHCGAGLNETGARKPAWFTVQGHKIAVLAYSLTYPTAYWATDKRAGCAVASGPEMREDIQKARAEGADLVIVCCHWGQEKKTRLRSYQPTLAHLAIDAGADAVVCHHPHIWQTLEVYHGKPIAYAIGNFCFGTLTSIRQSGILYLTFNPKDRWTGGRILPLNVDNYQVHFASQPMDERSAVKFYLYLKKLSPKADLRLVKGNPPEILWTAPKAPEEPAAGSTPSSLSPVKTVKASETPTPNASLPTPRLSPTPLSSPEANPSGSVPGAGKP